MAEKMKYIAAWPHKIEVRECDIPEPKDDQIRVKIEYGGICGTDLHVLEEGYGPHRISGAAEYPLVLGHEYSAIIDKKGKNADEKMFYMTEKIPEEGDRVYYGVDYYDYMNPFTIRGAGQWGGQWFYGFCPPSMGMRGAWAQYVILEPYSYIFDCSDLSGETTALIEPFIVGLRQANRAMSLASQSTYDREFEAGAAVVLIIGAGTIGNVVTLAVRRHLPNATIIQEDLKDYRLEFAKKNGADYTIDVSKTTPEEREEIIKDIATRKPRPDLGDKWGVDIVFDVTGRNAGDIWPEAIKMCRPGAVFIETGAYVAKTTGTFTLDPHEICCRELIISSGWAYPFSTINEGVTIVKKDKKLQEQLAAFVTHKHSFDEGWSAIESCFPPRYEGMKHVWDPWK